MNFRPILGDEEAKVIGKMLECNKSITSLNLSVNNITDVGAKALAKGLQFNRYYYHHHSDNRKRIYTYILFVSVFICILYLCIVFVYSSYVVFMYSVYVLYLYICILHIFIYKKFAYNKIS